MVSNWVPNPALHSDFAQHVDDYFSGPVLHIAPLETVELNIGFYYSSLKNLATYWSQTPSRTHQSNGFGALISLFDRSIQNRSFEKARDYLTQIRSLGRLTGSNHTFLELYLNAEAGEWADVYKTLRENSEFSGFDHLTQRNL